MNSIIVHFSFVYLQLERSKTKGGKWFNMAAPEMTEEHKNDLMVLQMRHALDPKSFYKHNDLKALPKFYQVQKAANFCNSVFSYGFCCIVVIFFVCRWERLWSIQLISSIHEFPRSNERRRLSMSCLQMKTLKSKTQL